MRIWRLLFILVSVSSQIVSVGRLPVQASESAARFKDMYDDGIEGYASHVQAFVKNHDTDELNEALAYLEEAIAVPFLTPQNAPGRERALIAAYSNFFSAIDPVLDRSFDPASPKYIHRICFSPAGSNYKPCTYPNSIKEPAIRARYEADLRADADRSVERAFQKKDRVPRSGV